MKAPIIHHKRVTSSLYCMILESINKVQYHIRIIYFHILKYRPSLITTVMHSYNQRVEMIKNAHVLAIYQPVCLKGIRNGDSSLGACIGGLEGSVFLHINISKLLSHLNLYLGPPWRCDAQYPQLISRLTQYR